MVVAVAEVATVHPVVVMVVLEAMAVVATRHPVVATAVLEAMAVVAMGHPVVVMVVPAATAAAAVAVAATVRARLALRRPPMSCLRTHLMLEAHLRFFPPLLFSLDAPPCDDGTCGAFMGCVSCARLL